MTKHKYTRAFTRLLQVVIKLNKTIKTPDIQWLLRISLVSSQRQLEGGFVLPTTVMVILVVTLVVTALIFRTLSRTNQVISERQQQVIYNSATPAIDRAKSKLEYLFRQDSRLPAGIPSDSTIQSILEAPATGDTYTLPGETRLVDFKDPNNKPAIGWYFQENGKTVAYSIVFKKQATSTDSNVVTLKDSANNKASYFVVRNGPVNTNQSSVDKCGGEVQLAANEKDWEPITAATLAKTFQVTALVIENGNKPNRTVTTLEFQQDRQADKGNKWGAYFRYDLELFNAPTLRWNGAMHSDGNMFFGPFGTFRSYLISSPASCVNTSANDSKLTVSRYTDRTTGNITFDGQIVAGRLNLREFGGESRFDLYNGNGISPTENEQFTLNLDSITLPTGSSITPADLALDPEALFTQDLFQTRNAADRTNTTYRDANWKTRSVFQKRRIFNEETIPPYLDDTYRADNRYGPNPTYDGKPLTDSQIKIPAGNKVGDTIPSTAVLTRNTPPDPRSPEALGLDGYWERRAVTGGLRVIVGQRLELGNPIAAPSSLPTGREHEFLQRRTQRDNVAAVQATAVYHYKSGSGTTPVACMATTVHPGTAETLKRSATFETITFKRNVTDPATGTTSAQDYSPIVSDFFTGRGTNGWEFSVPTDSTTLQNARANLANFAGDVNGAFPPEQDTAASPVIAAAGAVTHPYPELTKFGDFSNLRRANGIASPSIADQSYIHTANCLLGMLAYNINYLNNYDYALNWDTANSTVQLLDDLNTALGSAAGAVGARQPERAIAALEASAVINKAELVKLARLIATKERVNLDRRNGTGYSCDNTTFNANATALEKLCPARSAVNYSQIDVRYSVLYYIFPFSDHAEDRADLYITGVNPTAVTNRYKAISDTDISTIASTSSPNTGTWSIPRNEVTSSSVSAIPGQPDSLPNSNRTNLNNLVKYTTTDAAGTVTNTYYQVAFKDAAVFNGREMMDVRVLDVDLNLLRTTNAPGGDTWLPINDNTATDPNAPPPNGIVYAFREDAVREDAIARPAGASMNAIPGSLSDPTITSTNGITTKPVDYLPDPARRPYGFRLRNGSRLDRGTNTAGMSFISDNSVYIQGDFNLHSTDGTNTATNLLEEFKNDDPTATTPDNRGKLRDDWSNFYTRDRKDNRFAKPAEDTWRPTEVLGDSVTILSNNFCDGSIEDGIIYPGVNPLSSSIPPALNIANKYGCNTDARWTSYLNQNRPYFALDNNTVFGANRASNNNNWVRENSFDNGSAIKISENGKPYYKDRNSVEREYELLPTSDTNFPDSYLRFANQDSACNVGSNRKCISTATTTRVNAIIVQNIIPSRAGQSYGGFHMFPRMIENWTAQDLFMAGAFIQLRFSTQATGAFDQDSWEPSQTPLSTGTSHEYNWYFLPPNRRWGYDVALQYQTAGPVARRFAVPGTTRSEVYRELPLDDPYVKNLRCAKKDASGNRIDPTVSCS